MLKCGLRTLNIMKEPNGLFKHFSSSFDTDLQFQFTKRNRMHRCGNAITRRSTPLCIDIKSSKYKYFSNTPNRTSETLPSEQNAAVGENTGVADNVNTNIELEPFNYQDYFGVQELFTVKDLFNARVHLGHTVRSLCPQMRPFIFGTRFDTCIFDLDETALLLRQALNFIAHIAHRGGIILFVARQPQIVHMVERTAIECGEYAQCRQWVTETFTAPRLVRFVKSAFNTNIPLATVLSVESTLLKLILIDYRNSAEKFDFQIW